MSDRAETQLFTALDLAEEDAYYLGTGFIKVTRDEDGRIEYERIAPARVLVQP